MLEEFVYTQFGATIQLNCLAPMDHGAIIIKLKNSSLYMIAKLDSEKLVNSF
jgi:hypothetical protein